MTVTNKNRIKDALEEAKQQGQLRVDKIQSIVRNAIADTTSEVKEGRQEISSIVRDAVAAVIEIFQDKGGGIKEEITASLEGAIDGIRSLKRENLAQNRTELKQIQSQIDRNEAEFQQEIDNALVKVREAETTETNRSERVKAAITEAIETIRNSEEVALLQKRYAQLRAQLAIVDANLAERYGDRYEEVQHHLNEAKSWYEKAKEDPAAFRDKVDLKKVEFEQKLSEAGSAVAKRERQVKQLLRELVKSLTEAFRH
jgi:archaellum component FlaC